MIDSLKLLEARVLRGEPRRLHRELLQPMYLFTDASFDPIKGSGLGAVLVSGDGRVISWFGRGLSWFTLTMKVRNFL